MKGLISESCKILGPVLLNIKVSSLATTVCSPSSAQKRVLNEFC